MGDGSELTRSGKLIRRLVTPSEGVEAGRRSTTAGGDCRRHSIRGPCRVRLAATAERLSAVELGVSSTSRRGRRPAFGRRSTTNCAATFGRPRGGCDIPALELWTASRSRRRRGGLAKDLRCGQEKSCGRKRHILVDALGLVLAVVVHPANIQDRDGAEAPARRSRQMRYRSPAPAPHLGGQTGYAGLAYPVGTKPPGRLSPYRAGDRETVRRRPWLQGSASPLGRRAHLRLARTIPAHEQGLASFTLPHQREPP